MLTCPACKGGVDDRGRTCGLCRGAFRVPRWEDESISGKPWPPSCAKCHFVFGGMSLVDGELVHTDPADCHRLPAPVMPAHKCNRGV